MTVSLRHGQACRADDGLELDPEVVSAPVFDCPLKLFGFDKLTGCHGANQFFQFLVSGKTEGDYLPGSQRAYLLRERRGEHLLIA